VNTLNISKYLDSSDYRRTSTEEWRLNMKTASNVSADRKTKTLKYIVTRTIGKGAFGVVYLAMEEKTEKIFAIKETFQDAHYKNREAQIVRDLDHPNVVKVHHVFFSQKSRGTYLHLVMDHVPSNLFDVIQKHKRSDTKIPTNTIRLYMYQICRALGYIHKQKICHRDVKPQNILVDPSSGKVQICDFGSAKILVDKEWNKTYICSRFYRAPELLFQSNYYTTAVDVWSVGCVFAEMFHLTPIFAAPDTDGQITVIANVLGTVGREHIRVFRLETSRPIPNKPVKWSTVLSSKGERLLNVCKDTEDLLSLMLTYDCISRVRAYDGLKHKYFDKIREDISADPKAHITPTADEKKAGMC